MLCRHLTATGLLCLFGVALQSKGAKGASGAGGGAGAQSSSTKGPERKKEIYTYTAPWQIYGMNWSMRDEPQHAFR